MSALHAEEIVLFAFTCAFCLHHLAHDLRALLRWARTRWQASNSHTRKVLHIVLVVLATVMVFMPLIDHALEFFRFVGKIGPLLA